MVELKIDLADSFFSEEERSGYLVSAKIKELWAVQLDLLCEFDRICKKYGLKYILDFGTLLGAVRHQGFIPWDDDLDVSMLREDYDKLMEVGPREFTYPYFLQNQDTDKGYDISVAKLRRSDTTCLLEENLHHRTRYNQGIFIDIFVFDNVPSNENRIVNRINQESYDAFLHMYVMLHRPSLRDGFKFPLILLRYLYYKLCYGSAEKEYRRWVNISKQYGSSEYVANIMYVYTKCRPRIWFKETFDVSFEKIKFPIPKDYHRLLETMYGDYMTPVRGASAHTMVYFDTDRPYNEVIKEKKIF